MSTKDSTHAEKLSLARGTMFRAENALQRKLEAGEVRDFILDNFEDWARSDAEAVWAELVKMRQ